MQRADDRGGDLGLERARHLVAADLDARELVVVADAADAEAERAQRLFGRARSSAASRRSPRCDTECATTGTPTPARPRSAGPPRRDSSRISSLVEIDLVERAAHAELARGLPARPIVAAIVGVVAVDDDRVPRLGAMRVRCV